MSRTLRGWGVFWSTRRVLPAVFILTTSTLALRTRAMPRWLAILGYVIGTGLIFTPFSIIEQTMVFPAWVIPMSLVILIHRRALPATLQATDSPTPAENQSWRWPGAPRDLWKRTSARCNRLLGVLDRAACGVDYAAHPVR